MSVMWSGLDLLSAVFAVFELGCWAGSTPPMEVAVDMGQMHFGRLSAASALRTRSDFDVLHSLDTTVPEALLAHLHADCFGDSLLKSCTLWNAHCSGEAA